MRSRTLALTVFTLGLLALGSGCQYFPRWNSSEGNADRAVTRAPDPGPTEVQQERLADAEAAKDRGDYDVALTMFQSILAENPTITTAYLGVGDIYLVKEDFSSAEGAYRRAARLERHNFDAQYGHGFALQMLERFAEAVQAYMRALTIQPDSLPANLNIATTYLQQGKARLARRFAEKAVELDPRNASARVNLGAIYDQLDLYPEAIETYRVALELVEEPTTELIMNLVNALGHAKRYREAIDAAVTLNRIEESANAYERMGWAWFRLNDYEQSATAYRKAVELDPDHWVAWRGIGVNAINAWLLSKKRDQTAASEAKAAFRRSLRINADQPKVIRLLSTYRL